MDVNGREYLARMAELKGLSPEEMAAITWKNTCSVYGLPE